jgi:DNA-binding beta-propeller fold protein YncE/tRNA A-37 threonylcarbamoyl transferase component Bud32
VSEQSAGPGGFGPGSHIAGYRLDEQIGRGGMAVVYRAWDSRLERRVALKILAPELARDDEFRQRFIRESRAAAAVDHHNIIPIYEAGEAAGVLFIAMRFVDGRDVQTIINQQGALSPARVCDIVGQVAAALDAAHAHGLVHRDVKPANMLRDPSVGSDRTDHVYLSDFGLSKTSVSASSPSLTSQGQFLGTLNYVAPEQIEGRPVDGRTDEYALACSTFEMLTGAPPFRRDETLAIMYAQLSSQPPAVTGSRPDLPAAVDQVMARALAKNADDRYPTCLEFAAALRRACGSGPGGTDPGMPAPGPGGTRAVRPAELASAAGMAAAGAAAAGPAAGGPAAGRPVSAGPAASAEPPTSGFISGGSSEPPTGGLGQAPAGSAEPPTSGLGQAAGAGAGWGGRAAASPPTRAVPVQPGGTKPGLTDPLGPGGRPLYRPDRGTGYPPGSYPPGTYPPGTSYPPGGGRPRRSRLPLVALLAVVILIAGGTTAYLLLGKPTSSTQGGGHGHHPATTAPPLALPPCTTQTARTGGLTHVRTGLVTVGGHPFDAVAAPGGFAFVSLGSTGLAVMKTSGFTPKLVQTVPVNNGQGMALTHDQKYLLVTSATGLTVFRVSDLEQGLTSPLGTLSSPGAQHPVEVAVSPDDKFAFVSIQSSNQVAVFNVASALATGFSTSGLVGDISMNGKDPVGIAATPDGKYVYVASGLNNPASNSAGGTLTVLDMHTAEVHPSSSVLKVVQAGCGPARVVTSADGQDVWVTAGGANALEGFSAAKLISDPARALIATVAVGQTPLGLVMVNNGSRIVVANSNRDKLGGSLPSLAIIDVAKALARKPALLGLITAGQTPRQFGLEPNGRTLLVTNTGSGQVEAVNIGQLP